MGRRLVCLCCGIIVRRGRIPVGSSFLKCSRRAAATFCSSSGSLSGTAGRLPVHRWPLPLHQLGRGVVRNAAA
ncbi:hypothetical protein XELAEV_18037801mg [Xenopus laevis]|uniref:Uncharacterized protein n=1 Tax=Xenopus laevis TaxID=8355 RepID=A0A974CE00_XENLA|nr:hypothetical protein XELAEV_18037801mg [Xenopus laevis]